MIRSVHGHRRVPPDGRHKTMNYYRGTSAIVCLLLAIVSGCRNEISKLQNSKTSATAEIRSNDPLPSSSVEVRLEDAVFQRLRQKIDWQLHNETLAKFADRLSVALGVHVFLDEPALEAAGVEPDTKLNGDYENVTLEFALGRVLKEFSLDWTLVDNNLLITAPEEIEKRLLTRVYEVGDLVSGGKFAQPDFEPLIDTIQNHVATNSWFETGAGEARASGFQANGLNLLVVSQTVRAHRQVAKLLSDLREARGKSEPDEHPTLSPEDLRAKIGQLDQPKSDGSQPKGETAQKGGHSKPIPLSSAQLKEAAQRCNQFSIDLFRKSSTASDQNHLASGYSARELLAFTALGSAGETRKEFEKLLQLPINRTDAAIEVLSLRSSLHDKKANGNEFRIGNGMWVQRDLVLKDQFIRSADKFMNAFAGRVDFRRPEAAVAEINRWIAENTGQRIKEMVSPDDIKPGTFLMLANTIYFLGTWEKPFAPERTKSRPFTFLGGAKANVETMNGEVSGRSGLDSDSGVQIVELPYRGKTKSMVILLPAKHEGALSELEAMLDAKKLEDWLAGLSAGEVKVSLPRFTFRRRFNLNGPLSSMGAHRMFDLKSADFSGISNNPLALQDVWQQTFIEVDESGTEAAAATAGGFFGGMQRLPKRELVVDRPFVFLIRDVATGCLIFVGRVTDPRAGK